MTANNVTYAVLGKPVGLLGHDKGYWDFFANRGAPGRLPVWGFATVTESRADGISEGDVFYGYYPMASQAVLTVENASAKGFVETTPRRLSMPPLYNHYQRVSALSDYRAEHHDYWPVFRPLVVTGWLIADQFEDDKDYGAEQVLVASASSKTAIGFGYSMKQRTQRPKMVGLTSKTNAVALSKLEIYDHVVAYDDIETVDGTVPSALVDIAGNGSVTQAVHARFGDALKYSMIVGKSHWDSAPHLGELPGPARQGFFLPGRIQKRTADWGPRVLGERLAGVWLGFMKRAPDIVTIQRRFGAEAALAAYREVLAGKADPKTGIVVIP
jgi:Protein of unknown function (DUF2855)